MIFAINVAAANDEPGLRAAKQLVAGEHHEIGARSERFLRQRLPRQAEGAEVNQRARTEVDDVRNAMCMRHAQRLTSHRPLAVNPLTA